MPLVNPKNKNEDSFNPNVDNSEIEVKPNKAGSTLTYLSFILIIPIFLYISTRNNLVRLQMKINEASSGIDVQLKKRRDTLIKLVQATKSSVDFEKSTLKQIVALRSGAAKSQQQEMFVGDKVTSKLNLAFEAYPDLKSNKSFQKLMESAEDIEREIAASRRLYNSYVNTFNTKIFVWPGSVIAGSMNLKKLPLFAASFEDKKDVSLSIKSQ